jgi:hypothetical protein
MSATRYETYLAKRSSLREDQIAWNRLIARQFFGLLR